MSASSSSSRCDSRCGGPSGSSGGCSSSDANGVAAVAAAVVAAGWQQPEQVRHSSSAAACGLCRPRLRCLGFCILSWRPLLTLPVAGTYDASAEWTSAEAAAAGLCRDLWHTGLEIVMSFDKHTSDDTAEECVHAWCKWCCFLAGSCTCRSLLRLLTVTWLRRGRHCRHGIQGTLFATSRLHLSVLGLLVLLISPL